MTRLRPLRVWIYVGCIWGWNELGKYHHWHDIPLVRRYPPQRTILGRVVRRRRTSDSSSFVLRYLGWTRRQILGTLRQSSPRFTYKVSLQSPSGMADLALLQKARYITAGLVAEFKRSGFTEEVNHPSNPLMLDVKRPSFSIRFCVSGSFFAESGSKRTIFHGPLTKVFISIRAGNHNRFCIHTLQWKAIQAVGYLKQKG
jgi:hypothetical protein